MTALPSRPDELANLLRYSASIGSDPLLIQAAGGNTSVKDGNVMWIKASGAMLHHAETQDIFAPVDILAIRNALNSRLKDADNPSRFLLGNASLRPSIETSLHAAFPQKVVVHVHCVNTLAHAVRCDAKELLDTKLARYRWIYIPYVKPGANLAISIMSKWIPGCNVVVLGNHGLVVAGETVMETAKLLESVVSTLTIPPTIKLPINMSALEMLGEQGWIVPSADSSTHQITLDPVRIKQAAGGSLYPDHVVFCGPGVSVVDYANPVTENSPVFALVRGRGALLRADASSGVKALAECLGNVLARVPWNAELSYLTSEQNAELLDWNAEKYRKKLNV